jgi:quinoprotein glucose dehydrogenase
VRGALLALAGFGSACAPAAETGVVEAEGARVEWPVAIGDAGGARYSALADIDTSTVHRLQPAWRWHAQERLRYDPGTGEALAAGTFQATPVMLGDTLYLSTAYSRAVALDATTGRELWAFDPDVTRWGPTASSHALFSHRGVAVWSDTTERRVFLAARWRLWALDARTGKPIPTFGVDGAADLSADLRWPVNRIEVSSSSPPAIWRDVVIVGSAIGDDLIYAGDPPGHVQAFDARSGRRLWRWDPIPPASDPAHASWEDSAAARTGHANVWSFITVDTARGLVYLPVSAASNDWYGGDRLGDNRWSESLVCLDARTGEQRWAQQLVHHGLWDYDPAAPPTLATVTVNGVPRDVVAQAGKTGFLYVYDRVTGEPIWPIEERAVPASDVPGERASPTQPFPTWPAPFVTQGVTLDDANDVLPDVRDSSLAFMRRHRLGAIFTPPSLDGTLVVPGWIGGAGWGATSLDPVRGVLYIKSTNRAALAKLARDSTGVGRPRYRLADPIPDRAATVRVVVRDWTMRRRMVRFPVTKPPYGTLTAIDLSTGTQRWQVVVGDPPERERHPALARSKAPPMGAPGPSGGLSTAGGLLFITGGSNRLFAIDAADGATRWSHALGRASHANPMTYRTRDGRQFIVVASGAGSDAVLQAFTLDQERQ